MCGIHRLSRIFQPITAVPKNTNLTHKDFMSKSQRLMLELGIIHQAIPGCFHFLPLGVKALEKVINIVDEEMKSIGGQKVIFPTLVKTELWEKSGRINALGPELISLKDRHDHNYILGPTHEETASYLLSTLAPMSYKKFPLLLYQITSKFRDEMKPRFGLIRGREFLMKDMYSFDLNEKEAMKTYNTVIQSYNRIFERIGVHFVKVNGSSGAMGGNLSHEYHYPAEIGDDKIFICHQCDHKTNTELIKEDACPKCGESKNITRSTAIEVAHSFFFGDKYAKPLNANYLDKNTKPHALQMGSYGIGVSRILGAALECLSLEQELRWPDSIAPYNVAIIPPKKGSKEAKLTEQLGENLYRSLESHLPDLKYNILLDDRDSLTIGRRLLDCRRTGIRYIVVLNKMSCENPPIFELNDIVENKQLYLGKNEIITYIKDNGNVLHLARSMV
ncbi:probable proline--tRNA ligase, mitochondrial [Anthonomus grandis grandis]|uniref:probable proline--tRNA ligase, mitochondrial n=1 Tax=Anthonomus grandis grandis TaxID=2921223 RepID=UPI00216602B2|nr:probable proline--tRNA ligase, mitochondrial [Anthonomus grandis grandis]